MQAKAACLLIDLCSSVLASWTAQVIAKVQMQHFKLQSMYMFLFIVFMVYVDMLICSQT